MQLSQKLIIFTRFPEAGKTKTRLISTLGPEGAAQFQKEMTEATLKTVNGLKNTSIEIRFEGGDKGLIKNWLGKQFSIEPQGPGDLGKKMERAFEESFDEGKNRIIIIGTDCPSITPEIIQNAFMALNDNDLALGPAKDGGYYLIGLRNKVPQLFQDIRWGTEEVFQKTFDVAKKLGLGIYLAETLSDIDRPEDLHVLKNCFRK